MQKPIVDSQIYSKDYYLADNEGWREFKQGLDLSIHDKFSRALKLAQIKPNDHVLDVGCGRGELVYYALRAGARALGIDYSQAAVEIAQETINRLPEELRLKGRAQVLPIENLDLKEKFDVIFMIETAEHMYDWQLQQAFDIFEKVLTDDGRLIMITPNYLYEKYLQPMKMIMDIPCLMFKWPLRILRGKYKPTSWKDFFSRIFRFKIDRGERNRQMHCNVTTPNRLKHLLKSFDAKIYCEDHSLAPISLLLKYWMGRDVIVVASKRIKE